MKPALLLCGVLVLVGCSPAVVPEDGGSPIDAGATDAGVADAGTADAGQPMDAGTDAGVTWVQVQPLLWAHCAECHQVTDGGYSFGAPQFLSPYAALLQPSTRCAGESKVACIRAALLIQATEGSRCRTYGTPFHREGWECLTPQEIDFVASWVDAGAPEY
jgi:hypothetical protein